MPVDINEAKAKVTSKLDTVQNKIDKMLSGVDALVTIRDNFLALGKDISLGKGIIDTGGISSFSAEISPFDLIIEVLKKTGNYDKVYDFIEKMITVLLPGLEVAVKASLLANIKGMISCDSNPLIPAELRKGDDSTSSDENGIMVTLESIDFGKILSLSPLSEEGYPKYFGIDKDDSAYCAARAMDFNAFLWYTIHKSVLPNPIAITDNDGIPDMSSHNMEPVYNEEFYLGGLCGTYITEPLIFDSTNELGGFIPGTVIKCGNQLSLCVKREVMENNGKKTVRNHFAPIGTSTTSANWYANRRQYANIVKPKKKQEIRDVNDEFPICCIEYTDTVGNDVNDVYKGQNQIKFTILPKPYIFKPYTFCNPLKTIPLLFNEKGEPSKDGMFTVNITEWKKINDEPEEYIAKTDGGDSLIINFTTKEYGKYDETGTSPDKYGNPLNPCLLRECYKGLTIYEFNYDYVMGMKLFDSKVITARLLELIGKIKIGGSIDFYDNLTYNRIYNIVRDIIEAPDDTSSDCYFNFSNDKYEMMMDEAEKSRYRRVATNGKENITREVNPEVITDILRDYDETSSLVEKTAVLRRAINQVCVDITEPNGRIGFGMEFGCNGTYGMIGWNILREMLNGLASAVTDAIVSPKLVLLFEVNRRIMRSNDEPLTLESFLRMIVGLIIAVVKEVKDYIIKELLEWLENEIAVLLAAYATAIAREQFDVYLSLYRQFKETCLMLFTGSEQASQLADVNYADIETELTTMIEKCD